MDPNTTLARLRAEVATHVEHGDGNVDELVEHFQALDEWIQRGGFFPSAWTEAQRRALENTRPTRLDLPPSPEDEARTELERRALNRTRTRCWQTTLAGTESPVPCPPPRDTVDEVSDLLDGDPWRP